MDHQQTIVTCYSFFDKLFPNCGMPDYTEGMYHDNPHTPFDVAQRNQIQYLLDEARCGAGTRILDIGCGNGELLAAAQRRGADTLGITISPEQVEYCVNRGLNVRLLDYRSLWEHDVGRFDAIIANGSIEHFASANAAAAGRDCEVYREMFESVHRLLDSRSPVRRFINTTIHFVRRPRPHDLLASPWNFSWGSDSFHFALLNRCFGGWYPALGQFERCAHGQFALLKSIDGTQDYRLTSETWLQRAGAVLRSPTEVISFARRSLPLIASQPSQCCAMLACMLVTQSWNWQFRGAKPPTRLLRQTWEYQPATS